MNKRILYDTLCFGRHISVISTAIVLTFMLGGCSSRTFQYRETTPQGVMTRTVNESTFTSNEEVTVDSDKAYASCKEDMNVRRNGAYAVEYCRDDTGSIVRRQDSMGPSSMMLAPGYGIGMTGRTGSYAPGMIGQTLYVVPPPPQSWEGTTMDPRYRVEPNVLVVAPPPEEPSYDGTSYASGDNIAPLARQTAENANRIRRLEEDRARRHGASR